jgi:hypothetical protein
MVETRECPEQPRGARPSVGLSDLPGTRPRGRTPFGPTKDQTPDARESISGNLGES